MATITPGTVSTRITAPKDMALGGGSALAQFIKEQEEKPDTGTVGAAKPAPVSSTITPAERAERAETSVTSNVTEPRSGAPRQVVEYRTVTKKVERPISITLPATQDELNQVTATSNYSCLGMRKTIGTWRMGLRDGGYIYVQGLNEQGATAKAKAAGYKVIFAGRSYKKTETISITAVEPVYHTITSGGAGADHIPPPAEPTSRNVDVNTYNVNTSQGTARIYAVDPDQARRVADILGYKNVTDVALTGTKTFTPKEAYEYIRNLEDRSKVAGAEAMITVGSAFGSAYSIDPNLLPMRDMASGNVSYVSKEAYANLPDKYKKILQTQGFDALTQEIIRSLPPDYQKIAKDTNLATAISQYNANVERQNEIIAKLPGNEKDGYDLWTPYVNGNVTADDLKVAGFDPSLVDSMVERRSNLNTLATKFDKYSTPSGFTLSKFKLLGEKPAYYSEGLKESELDDLATAIKEAGLSRNVQSTAGILSANKDLNTYWRSLSDADKLQVLDIYAGYAGAGKPIPSALRAWSTRAPGESAVATVTRAVATGMFSGLLNPVAKEQMRANVESHLQPYKVGNKYDITAYLKDNPLDASLLASGGIPVDDIQRALDGGSVLAKPRGATPQDWAISGLIVASIGAGSASVIVSQPVSSGLMAASGVSQLGLFGIGTADTVSNWRQMDNVERGISVAFDVMLLGSGILSTRAGAIGWQKSGGNLYLRNRVRSAYNQSRNFIRSCFSKLRQPQVDTVLSDIDRAIQTNNPKLLQAAARRLELMSRELPKQLREPIERRALLMEGNPEDYINLNKGTDPGLNPDIADKVASYERFIKQVNERIKNTTDRNRLKKLNEVLDETMRQREQAITEAKKVKLAEKTKDIFERVKWTREAGQDLPAETKTKALVPFEEKPKPAPVSPKTITVGGKAIPVKTLTREKIEDVSHRYGVSIWDITRQTRKLPKGVQEEIALNNPLYQTIALADEELQRKLGRSRELRVSQKQGQAIAPYLRPQLQPLPLPAQQAQTKPQSKEALQKKTKTMLQFQEVPVFMERTAFDLRSKPRRLRRGKGVAASKEAPIIPLPANAVRSWRQGMIYITIIPTYRTEGAKTDVIYSRQKPRFISANARGRRSPQKTLGGTRGRFPGLVNLPMGVTSAHIHQGKRLHFGRRRGRILKEE